MNIDEAPPGPELDAACARAMGWKADGLGWLDTDGKWRGYCSDNTPGYAERWQPSTQMEYAWELVEAMVNEGSCPGLLYDDNGHWALAEEGMQNVPMEEKPEDVMTCFFVEAKDWNESAPLAICRAFLKAKGVECIPS